MIKLSTLLNDVPHTTQSPSTSLPSPGPGVVNMLIRYSQALQVIPCTDFETCFIILN
jgi:hypothetical protein